VSPARRRRPRRPATRAWSLLALALAVAGLTGAACGGGGLRGPASGGNVETATDGRLTVATADLPVPGFWAGTADHPTGGFEWGLARALADQLGLDRVDVVEVDFQQLVGGDLGGADLALAQLTPTDERGKHVDFSTAYLPAPPGILVRPGIEVPDVHAAQRLEWVVQRSTTLADVLDDEVRPKRAPTLVEGQGDVIDAVRTGAAEAGLLDLPTALATADASDGALAVAAQLPGEEVLAAALPEGSPNVDAVDSALRALRADGTLDDLAARWLGTETTSGDPDVRLVRTGA
jgi:polar amino acid transport system substrate-binding protein